MTQSEEQLGAAWTRVLADYEHHLVSERDLSSQAAAIIRLAEAEGLSAHAGLLLRIDGRPRGGRAAAPGADLVTEP